MFPHKKQRVVQFKGQLVSLLRNKNSFRVPQTSYFMHQLQNTAALDGTLLACLHSHELCMTFLVFSTSLMGLLWSNTNGSWFTVASQLQDETVLLNSDQLLNQEYCQLTACWFNKLNGCFIDELRNSLSLLLKTLYVPIQGKKMYLLFSFTLFIPKPNRQL